MSELIYIINKPQRWLGCWGMRREMRERWVSQDKMRPSLCSVKGGLISGSSSAAPRRESHPEFGETTQSREVLLVASKQLRSSNQLLLAQASVSLTPHLHFQVLHLIKKTLHMLLLWPFIKRKSFVPSRTLWRRATSRTVVISLEMIVSMVGSMTAPNSITEIAFLSRLGDAVFAIWTSREITEPSRASFLYIPPDTEHLILTKTTKQNKLKNWRRHTWSPLLIRSPVLRKTAYRENSLIQMRKDEEMENYKHTFDSISLLGSKIWASTSRICNALFTTDD